MISLAIGLGNNNPQYEHTYHNVGFLMIDWLNAKPEKLPIGLYRTSGFMNESGASVKKILRESGSAPEELLVIHDDSDIELGQYKLSFDRGAAGYEGAQNVIDQIGTKRFYRLRLGIRPHEKPGERKKADEFVLKNISKTNLKILDYVFQEAATNLSSQRTLACLPAGRDPGVN